MKHFALVLAITLQLGAAQAAPLFPDVGDVPARPAVETLSTKGVVSGYPDGTFKGNRAITRYEAAEIIARLIALDEKAHAGLATKAELAELQALVGRLQQGASDVEARTGTLESTLDSLQRRVKQGGKNKGF